MNAAAGADMIPSASSSIRSARVVEAPRVSLFKPIGYEEVGDLAPHVAPEPELAEDVRVVERREARVELILLLDCTP
jgi:hypothetical protein